MKQTKYSEEMKKYIGTNVHAMGTLPATDGNFVSAVGRATDDEIKSVYRLMTTHPEGNKSRITAIEKEIKKRKIEFEPYDLLSCKLDSLSETEQKFTLWYLLQGFVQEIEKEQKSFRECENKLDLATETLRKECENGANKIREVLACDLW